MNRFYGESPVTKTMCIHCKHMTERGTHNGCADCGRVKHTRSGRIESSEAEERAARQRQIEGAA